MLAQYNNNRLITEFENTYPYIKFAKTINNWDQDIPLSINRINTDSKLKDKVFILIV